MAHSVENPTIRTKNYTTPGDATVGKIVTRSVTVIGSMMAGFIGFLIYTTLTR
jgi:hypothetical protein